MKQPGIHTRMLAAAILLIFATTFTLDMVGIHLVEKFMSKRFRDRIEFLAEYLALNAEVGVLIGDKAGLKSLALNLMGQEDVANVIIYDSQDNELVNLTKPSIGPLSRVEMPVQLKKVNDENMLFKENVISPFGNRSIPGSEHIGKVHIHYSVHGINTLLKDITRGFIWFSFGLAFLAAAGFHFLSRSLAREITSLVHTVTQVGRGDLELRAIPGNLPEIRSMAIAFNGMLDSLENSRKALGRVTREMIRQKSLAEVGKFSMMIAHELKNPLGIIKSSLDILKKDFQIPSDDTMVFYIEDEIRRMNSLIEDFLVFSHPGKPTFRSVDTNEMLLEIIERFRIQHVDFPLKIDLDALSGPDNLIADRDLLIRGLNNIIKNACEACHYEGQVCITSTSENGTWHVVVEDDGEGLPEGEPDKLFDPFFTTRSKGTGLGLAFAAQAVKAHGGRISASNRAETRGAQFEVRIPLNSVEL
ncbi:MAG: HAMP domain-containing sensor histidine kinase [Pseudomonadota bacterium]